MRSVRLVAPALLVMCGSLVAACGSGQVAQTSTQVITAEGANAERGGVALRTVLIPTPARGKYQAGDPAPLYLAIATEEGTSDTLLAVTTPAAASVTVIRSPFASGAAAPSVSAGASASASASASAQPSASPSPDAGLQVAENSLILLTQGGNYLELQDLVTDLLPGNTVSVTFSFARAGDITIDVPVATPDAPGPRLKPSEGEHE